MIFFIGWQLWQEMTFILACLIAVVFALGFLNLWRTNRILRRYELLDEEKRTRMAEMQQYGIDIPAINDIPFGSRAIQSGVEVDGIWISRPNTPAASQRASTATVMDDSSVDGALHGGKGASSASANNPSETSHAKSKTVDRSSAVSSKAPERSTLSEQHGSESNAVSDGFQNQASNVAGRPDLKTEPVVYGTAAVFANTKTRRTVSGFEILPAGSLGERVEFHSEDRRPQRPAETRRTPNKLQKPAPNPN